MFLFGWREGGMRLQHTPEQEALRHELRAYFDRLMTPDLRRALTTGDGDYGDGVAYRALVRQLGADGWLTVSWPPEYGGRGFAPLDQMLFMDEAASAGVPVPFLTINTVGPTIMHFGTPEQKAFFLPGIAAGRIHFAIGYSEPDAGTDLAALRTRADRTDGGYVVNGQKMWTSLIQYADYVWLACRTDPQAPPHRGLSILVVPTDAPGFSWTPVPTMAGPTTSATFYDDVRVPASALIGPENGGWSLITNQLNHERVALTSAGPIRQALGQVTGWARATRLDDGRRVIDQEWVQIHLGRVHARADALGLLTARIAAEAAATPDRAAASAVKVFGTELAVESYRLLMEVLGPNATVRGDGPGAVLHGRLESLHRSALILTFGGGTNEIQRDIVAAAGLGLPPARR